MSFRARFTLLVGAWAVVVSGLVVAVPFWWRQRLPDPIATHWGLSGVPDGSSSFVEFAVLPVGVWALLAGIALAPLLRGRGVSQRRMRGWTGALLCGGAVFSVGLAVLTAWANLDVPDWRQARALTWQVVVLLVFSCGAGWSGWWVARLGPDGLGPDGLGPDGTGPDGTGPDGLGPDGTGPGKTGSEEHPDRRTELDAQPLRPEGLVWVASATNRWLLALSAFAAAVLVLLLVLALFGSTSTPWVFAAMAALSVPTSFALSAVRVRVGEEGVTIACSPLRWPVRRIPLSKVDGARVEVRNPSSVGGWGYRGLPGHATIMLRGGECLVLRYRSGSELGISVDDAERGAGLINALLEDAANSRSS